MRHAWDPFYFNLTCVMDGKIQSCGERKCKEGERVGENTEGWFSGDIVIPVFYFSLYYLLPLFYS